MWKLGDVCLEVWRVCSEGRGGVCLGEGVGGSVFGSGWGGGSVFGRVKCI